MGIDVDILITRFMKRYIGFVLMAGMLLFAGCQGEPDNLQLYDQLVVSTNYDTTAVFNDFGTYAISTDTIGYYSNTSSDTILVQSSGSNYPPRPLLQQIQKNLDARGFTRVTRENNPDIGINVYVLDNFSLYQTVNYGYYPSYYGYSSYYSYPYISTYSSSEASLVIEFIDLKNITHDNKVRVIWTAYMGDLYNAVDRNKQSLDGIDQAFVQSPYLDK